MILMNHHFDREFRQAIPCHCRREDHLWVINYAIEKEGEHPMPMVIKLSNPSKDKKEANKQLRSFIQMKDKRLETSQRTQIPNR
jgi:hypothetical protein